VGAGLDAVFERLAPDLRWEEAPSLGPSADVYEGDEGARQAYGSWIAMWDDYETAPVEYVDAGDEVVVLSRESGRGRHSGVRVEREVAQVHTFRDGVVIRIRVFPSWREVLEAAGLSE
jgi:ketosteroid isomerase-like protein